MAEPKWTPGPWEAINLDDPTIFPSVVLHRALGSSSRRPAQITINEGPSPEMIQRGGDYGGTTIETASANARLIAAVPQLYGALAAQEQAIDEHSKCDCSRNAEDFLTGMCMPCTSRYMRASDMRTAALRKARGEIP